MKREKSWLMWPNRSLWSSQRDLIHVVELDGRHSLITGTWIRCCRTIDLTLMCFFNAWIQLGKRVIHLWEMAGRSSIGSRDARNSFMSISHVNNCAGRCMIGWFNSVVTQDVRASKEASSYAENMVEVCWRWWVKMKTHRDTPHNASYIVNMKGDKDDISRT